ncbi:MAG: hypothetical protein Q9162_000427 [Coniocarpon cinnabarinum]
MGQEGSVRKRPDLWSYISFSRPNSRNGSSSLPHPNGSPDPFGGAERTPKRSRGYSVDQAYMHQAHWQRNKTFRYLGLGLVVFVLLYFLAPAQYISRPGYTSGRGGQRVSDSSAASSKCTESYSPTKPLIQYALMIDAGSTGSRIHVYRFNNCGPTPELENEEFKMTAKKEGGSGLSSYDSDAESAAKSLDELMSVAMQSVPEAYKSCSPIAVKATAGLRKLGTEKSNRILEAVRKRLETEYPFPLVSGEKGGVEVMGGDQEGVYAWITTNYLLGKIGGPDKTPSAAVFDLGGGSTQIVFEPTFPQAAKGGMPEHLADGDHKYNMTFGGRNFELYQHSYLGYGLMEARKKLHHLVLDGARKNGKVGFGQPIVNPCIAPGMSREIEMEPEDGGKTYTVNMTGPDSGSHTQCRAIAEKALHKEKACSLQPCAFDGVHQPSLQKTFAREDVYLFSYFYDRTQPLGMPDSFTLEELKDLTEKVCNGEDSWESFAAVDGALDELRDRPEHCLDLNFMLALLHSGYDMPMDREVKIAKKIKGNELGWCLGASLPLLEKGSGWECKMQQIE